MPALKRKQTQKVSAVKSSKKRSGRPEVNKFKLARQKWQDAVKKVREIERTGQKKLKEQAANLKKRVSGLAAKVKQFQAAFEKLDKAQQTEAAAKNKTAKNNKAKKSVNTQTVVKTRLVTKKSSKRHKQPNQKAISQEPAQTSQQPSAESILPATTENFDDITTPYQHLVIESIEQADDASPAFIPELETINTEEE